MKKNLNITVSPEILTSKKKNKSLFQRIISRFFSPLIYRISYSYDKYLFRNNSYDQSFNWNWEEVNYNRNALINSFVNLFESPKYLEIGCDNNSLFNSVSIIDKIGVDPNNGGTHRMTSDEFFKEFKGSINVVFIDGLHTYEQARRDFVNALKHIDSDGGFIAFHDMLPNDWIEQHVPLISRGAWTGDVWKLAFELKDTFNSDFKIIRADYGLGVVRINRDNRNKELKDYSENLEEAQFDYLFNNIQDLPIYDWQDFNKWLKSLKV
mgnify:CR=1 FL=1